MGLQANTGLQPEQGAKAACCHTTAVAPGVMRWPRAPHCGATSHHQPRASHRSAAPPGAGWCPGPLRAPLARADDAVPLGAAARRDLLRRRGGRRRCEPAVLHQRRVRCIPRLRHPGARLPAPALRRLRPRQAGGIQLQAPGVLSLVRRAAHVADCGAPGRETPRSPRRCVPTSRASACTRLCVALPMTARRSSSYAAISRARRWPTSVCRSTAPGRWCSG